MRLSAHAAFAFILLVLLSYIGILPALSLQSSSSIVSYGKIVSGWPVGRPYVEGSKIMFQGSEFVPIGVIKAWSIVYYAPNFPSPTNWPDETLGVYNLLNDPSTSERETNFNTVMLSENRWLWENDLDYIPALHKLVNMAKERGLFVIIRWGDWNNRNESSPEFNKDFMTWQDKVDIIVELESWREHVMSIAQEFKDEPAVIGIDPLNEPTAPENGWTAKGYSPEEAQQIWYDHALQIIDSIHNVDPSYIIFLPLRLDYNSPEGAIPWNRSNIVYTVHWYYGWDTEWGVSYADAYWNAQTETDFINAYSLMLDHYQRGLLNFRNHHNVPVMNSETSMCKVSYRTGNSCKNTERQFSDQIRLGAENSLGQLYWQHDRNKNSNYWGLLDANNPEAWSTGGIIVKNAVNEYCS